MLMHADMCAVTHYSGAVLLERQGFDFIKASDSRLSLRFACSGYWKLDNRDIVSAESLRGNNTEDKVLFLGLKSGVASQKRELEAVSSEFCSSHVGLCRRTFVVFALFSETKACIISSCLMVF